MTAVERAEFNPADIGGDILGGAFTFAQAIRRPVVSPTPWRTPLRGVYLASASTPPGPGRHRHARAGTPRDRRCATPPASASNPRTSSGRDVVDGFAAVDFEFARQVLQRGHRGAVRRRVRLDAEPVPAAPRRARAASRAGAARTGRAPRSARGGCCGPRCSATLAYTDRRLVALCACGHRRRRRRWCVGIPQLGPPWVPMLCFLALWLGYMSIVSIGQTFYGFGWEMLLLEAGFLAAFLGSDSQPPRDRRDRAVLVAGVPARVRRGDDQDPRRTRVARPHRAHVPPRDAADARTAQPPGAPAPPLVPPGRGARQPLRAARRAVVPLRAARSASGCRARCPAIVGAVAAAIVIATQLWLVAHRQLRVAQLGDDRARLLGDRAARHRRAAAAATDDPPWLIDGIPLPWLIVTTAVGVLYVGAQLAAAAQPLRAAPAHERELQPLAARQRLRRVRHRHEGAHRDRRRGDDG